MRNFIAALLLVLALPLAGCIADATRDDLVAFTLEDVREAKASAEAWGDIPGTACWSAAERWLVTVGKRRLTDTSKGFASKIQFARNARRTAERGLPEDVEFNCALVFAEAKRTPRRVLSTLVPGGGLLRLAPGL